MAKPRPISDLRDSTLTYAALESLERTSNELINAHGDLEDAADAVEAAVRDTVRGDARRVRLQALHKTIDGLTESVARAHNELRVIVHEEG